MFMLMLTSAIVANYDKIVPPAEFRDNNGAQVEFVSDSELASICGLHAAACTKRVGADEVIYILNPCRVIDHDEYSTILCHELGHVNGWEADHRRK